MITPQSLQVFQTCRALWKFESTAGPIMPYVDAYTYALRKTIFQGYSWLQERNKPINDKRLRERWDKNWWLNQIENGNRKANELVDTTLEGWLYLFDYLTNFYLPECGLLTPVAINFDFNTYIKELHYCLHIDLILANQDGSFILRQFGPRLSERELYGSLATKLEVVALEHTLNSFPIRKEYFFTSGKEVNYKTIDITKDYVEHSRQIINEISDDIRYGSIYGSFGGQCSGCQYTSKCWF